MAKFVKKDKLTMKQGRIVTKKKGKVIGLPHDVYYQIDKLELIAQKLEYLVHQPKAQEAPSLEGFKRETSFFEPDLDIKAGTPNLDKKVEEAKAIMDEIDLLSDKEIVERILGEFTALIRWCSEDEFVPGDCYLPIDTPILGDVLHLDEDTILELISGMVRSDLYAIMRDEVEPRTVHLSAGRICIRDYHEPAYGIFQADRDGDR